MLILKALEFAKEKHKNQIRKVSKAEYVTHPIAVSYLLASYKKSKNMEYLLCAALLHDTLEDTDTTIEEIKDIFGEFVSNLVVELTSDPNEIKNIGKNEYLKNKLLKISSYALTIKLVDRLSNILDNPTDKYKSDTIDLVLFLEKNRRLNRTQKVILSDILLECSKNK